MKIIKNVKYYFTYAISYISPVMATYYLFRSRFGRSVDLQNPKTLNEKIQWLKLYYYADNNLVIQCADKYRVREYVKNAGLEKILAKLHGCWNSSEEICWKKLPDSFVLKCNHGCGYNYLVPDKKKLCISDCKEQLDKWMHHDWWRVLAEPHYRRISKRIICEEYLNLGETLIDYKFYCFNGKPEYILTCIGREKGRPKFYFFDKDWRFCPITKDGREESKDFTIPKPDSLDSMLLYASKLSEPFPFVRVDLYSLKNRIVFGELTFTPSAGLDTDRLPETDIMFGNLLDISGLVLEKNKN